MSISKSFSVDIVGKEVLMLDAKVELLKFVEEKENLFTNFPIGATIQDGGKRKRQSLGPPLWGTLLKPQEVFSRELSPTY